MPTWGAVYFQNSVSSVMEELIFFHDHSMMVMIIIMVLVGYVMLNSYFSKYYNLSMVEGQEMESVWTILPAIFLLFIAFPSLRLLYLMEEFDEYSMTVKVLGHQWYWSYEYGDLGGDMFDSYLLNGEVFRLLNVDNMMVIPEGIDTRVVISSVDVIHSWTIPSLGVKVDAVPGRLNQLFIESKRSGVFFGECSEICGANHSFMPIMLGVVLREKFLSI